MFQSDHDKVAEAYREKAKEELIEQYIQEAIQSSEEFGFLNVRGHEVPDPTVVEPPLGYVAAPDLMEQMRRMVRTELSRIAALEEMESFEEADDFDIEDDPVDYTSPYEMYFDPLPGAPGGKFAAEAVDPNSIKAPPADPPADPPPPPGEPNKGA